MSKRAAKDDADDGAVAAAADELYGVPLGQFTAERKRLADARKAAGDKAGAAAILKLAKPPMSVWVVNRLWREARDDVDELMKAGAAVRKGDRGALEAQRAALGRLRAKSAAVLVGDGHAAAPATLQRIATTLQALSALGTWEPDRPGQLVEDRDPPGFNVMIGAVLEGPAAVAATRAAAAAKAEAEADAEEATRAKGRAGGWKQAGGGGDESDEAEDELARARAAKARAARAEARAAERAALVQSSQTAQRDLSEKTAVRDRARIEVQAAETALEKARAKLASAEAAQDEAADRAGRADAAIAALDAEAEEAGE